ncbi:MAG: DNA mismatch repair protein MutS [Verrucomicrobia bacterium]|nr:DNA mismatch repair protein MutS [Verrucomicrobiota bacterium]MBV9272398.1 DNA mismatch repair protein MutS [Verrucomicrobiota bacterium]
MKVCLLHPEHDYDSEPLPWNEQALVHDLGLDVVLAVMAQRDKFLFAASKEIILSSLATDVDTILYRQRVLQDCLKHSSVVRELYSLAVRGVERENKGYWSFFSKYPTGVLNRSLELIQMLLDVLRKLRILAEKQTDGFNSEGFRNLFAMLKRELTDEYLDDIRAHLQELRFLNGVLISAELGEGNKGANYVLRKSPSKKTRFLWFFGGGRDQSFQFRLHPRDQRGAKALGELNERGIDQVANVLGQSADYILAFFKRLRTQLGFYLGCMNLHQALAKKKEPVCLPVPVNANERRHSFTELYDIGLALSIRSQVVGNDLGAEHKDMVIITGANQGGKSTFLRSIGLAQLMMQAGMFVGATSFSANLCSTLCTHYRREEDETMNSGKFDEELQRMDEIVDHLSPNSLVLFNESFAATNEREGSEIARQIVSALAERRIKMFFVSHQYTFTSGFHGRKWNNVTFLRAERRADGSRTYKLVQAEPLRTSYGEDLYNRIFEHKLVPERPELELVTSPTGDQSS